MISLSVIESMQPVECSCNTCQDMCRSHPCSGTPSDIEKLMDMGLIDRLALDRFEVEEDDPWLPGYRRWRVIKAILPAVVGNEFGSNPLHGQCTFLGDDGLCQIHADKPIVGKLASCSRTMEEGRNIHEVVIDTWDTPEGKRVRQRFHEEINAFYGGASDKDQ